MTLLSLHVDASIPLIFPLFTEMVLLPENVRNHSDEVMR